MHQRWECLLFLHWKYSVDAIQRTLPEGLWVDTYDGDAYLGIVPFWMRGIRPRFLPAVPGISNFLELNLRTYVYDRNGVPGVWFYSLDASQRLAACLGRRVFRLPYHFSAIEGSHDPEGRVRFSSRRAIADGKGKECRYDFSFGMALPPATPESLNYFLVERYRLYAALGDRIWRGTVAHEPYPLREATLFAGDDGLLELNELNRTGRPPDHVVASPGVKVKIYPLERV